METKEEEDASLVEEREAKVVPLLYPGVHIKRKAWFLKPIANTMDDGLPETPVTHPPHYKAPTFTFEEPHHVKLEGWVNPQALWVKWVSKLQPRYGDSWRKAGIFDAIQVSTYKIKKSLSLVLGVAAFWCQETNTFLFPWGEATLTLEDVMVLGCFSVLGEPVQGEPLPGERAEFEFQMIQELRNFNQSSYKKAHQSAWVKHYYSQGNGGELEHIAFLAFWLSRFVLPVHPVDTVRRSVIPIAIRLAQETRISFAPAVLASLYHDLGMVKNYFLANGQRRQSPLVLVANFKILHLWVWERFVPLRPGPQNFVDFNTPRAARWNGLDKKLEISYVRTVIEEGGQFQWRPYPMVSVDEGKWFTGCVDEDDELRSFARCLRMCELVGIDCIEKYFPNRVAMQFGLDQDIPMHALNENAATFAVEKAARFYVSPLCFEPSKTCRYLEFWRKFKVLFSGVVEFDEKPGNSKKSFKKFLRELHAVKKKRKRMVNGKKQRDGDSYDIKLFDWLSLNKRTSSKKIKPLDGHSISAPSNIKVNGLCLTDEMRRAKKILLKKKKKKKKRLSYLDEAKNKSEVFTQTEEGETRQSRELAQSEINDKENMNGELINSSSVIEEFEAAFESQLAKIQINETVNSVNSIRKESELAMQIRKLKEEIAVIEARVMSLESLRDGNPCSVMPSSSVCISGKDKS
ncbi:uncharacterized protein LOC120266828 [Dioscorea cayenensis subsp. rotundata]|uniref:Uncharacterized protein LOC120266828 n=1 Tax=Dioscorea cayennensis subsp. rotundata TaxID=55577 RepID=A0AB40BSJ2_DIOCR|nr:uncharacterized protein LOC120266828 [Dioscorea cayenensis subsp. rotundata]